LLVASPARAEKVPGTYPAPQVPEAPTDAPTVSFIGVPIPLYAVYGLGAIQNIRIGNTRHDLNFRGGYIWTDNTAYDPKSTQPRPLFTGDAFWQPANYWNVVAAWGWHVVPNWTLYLDGYAAGGGLATVPGYDDALAAGTSVTWGPLIDFNTLDDQNFPTKGFLAEAGWAPGYHFGAQDLAYQRGSLELREYVPLGPNQTLGLRGIAMAGWPKLAWVDKFYAGGARYLRGYLWSRFTGDRLLSATVEYRHLFAPDLLGLFGLRDVPAVGLAWEVYLDGGRAWEANGGVQLLSDLRYGGGTGLILTVNKAPLGRLELNGSPEGFYPLAGVGSSF
jgi:hypothetical protein